MKTSHQHNDSGNISRTGGPFFHPSTGKENAFFGPGSEFFPAIQPKLTIGEPGDQYEQEADAMADHVVSRQPMSPQAPALQSKCAACAEEEARMKPEVQKMGEEPEEEDMQMKPEVHRIGEEEEEMQTKPEIQKLETTELYEEREKLQTKPDGHPKEAGPEMEQQLKYSGGGQGLPTNTLSEMNRAFGADFSQVKVHTDSKAVQMSKDIGAQAFTHGSNIFFNQGKYNPESTEGKKLLAHELTHTIHQGSVKDENPS